MSILGQQAMIMLVGGTGPSYADVVLADVPVAWWRLNTPVTNGGPAPDASGNGRPATFTVGSADASAQPGPSIVSGSPSSYAKTGVNPAGAVASGMPSFSASYSVEAWVKTTDTGATRQIVAIDNEASNRLFQFRLNAGKPTLVNIRGDIIGVGSASTITDNVRHHLVATIDATATTNNILVYVDGAVVATGSANTSGMGTADACIGCYRDVSSHPEYQLSGSIADVAIYDKVLSADRVMAHWLAGR